MNKHNDGGLAFPSDGSGGHVLRELGMTLRQYYKAHAPKEIPNWFWPDVEHEIPPMPKVSAFVDEDTQKAARSWVEDPCWDLRDTHPRLAWFEDACIAHWNAKNERDRLKTIERARQWPGHWADLMLDEDHNRGK